MDVNRIKQALEAARTPAELKIDSDSTRQLAEFLSYYLTTGQFGIRFRDWLLEVGQISADGTILVTASLLLEHIRLLVSLYFDYELVANFEFPHHAHVLIDYSVDNTGISFRCNVLTRAPQSGELSTLTRLDAEVRANFYVHREEELEEFVETEGDLVEKVALLAAWVNLNKNSKAAKIPSPEILNAILASLIKNLKLGRNFVYTHPFLQTEFSKGFYYLASEHIKNYCRSKGVNLVSLTNFGYLAIDDKRLEPTDEDIAAIWPLILDDYIARMVTHPESQARLLQMSGTGVQLIEIDNPESKLYFPYTNRKMLVREICKEDFGSDLIVLDEITAGLLHQIIASMTESGECILNIPSSNNKRWVRPGFERLFAQLQATAHHCTWDMVVKEVPGKVVVEVNLQWICNLEA